MSISLFTTMFIFKMLKHVILMLTTILDIDIDGSCCDLNTVLFYTVYVLLSVFSHISNEYDITDKLYQII